MLSQLSQNIDFQAVIHTGSFYLFWLSWPIVFVCYKFWPRDKSKLNGEEKTFRVITLLAAPVALYLYIIIVIPLCFLLMLSRTVDYLLHGDQTTCELPPRWLRYIINRLKLKGE